MSVSTSERMIIDNLMRLDSAKDDKEVEDASTFFSMVFDDVIDKEKIVPRKLISALVARSAAKLCVAQAIRVYTITHPGMLSTIEGVRKVEGEMFVLAKCISVAVQEETAKVMGEFIEHALIHAERKERGQRGEDEAP